MHELHYKRPLWVWIAYCIVAVFLVIFSTFVGYMIFGFTNWLIHIEDMRWDSVFYALNKSFKIGRNPAIDIIKLLLTLPVFYMLIWGLRKSMRMSRLWLCYTSCFILGLIFLITFILFFDFLGHILPMVQRTLSIAIFGCIIGFFLGLVIVAMRMSIIAPLRWISYSWVYVFRGTPFILQAYFFWNLSGLLLGLGWAHFFADIFFYISLPFSLALEKLNMLWLGFLSLWGNGFLTGLDSMFGSQFASMESGAAFASMDERKAAFIRQFNRGWNSPYWWVLIASAINSSAYGSEIIRGGLLSVRENQMEAAEAFGMSKSLSFRRIRLKQAIAQALPAYSNEVILVLKATVVASAALSFVDFWDGYQQASSKYTMIFAPLIVIGFCYFVTNFSFSRLFRYLEIKANPWIYKNQSS